MNTKYIRETLTEITEKTERIKEIHTYFINNANKKYEYEIINTVSDVFGHRIETIILLIKNCHGLIFRLSSDYHEYSIFKNYIVGNYSQILNKWKYSPIDINYKKSNEEILNLFVKYSDKRYLRMLQDIELDISILYSDYQYEYNGTY